MITVTPVTKDASIDAFTEQDYIEIYQEVRGYDEAKKGTRQEYAVSLDKFVEMYVGAYPSKAAWSKWHNGDMALNRTMKNQLRFAGGIPLLPLSIEQALADIAQDAEIVQIGDSAEPHRVIKIATTESLTIYVNGTITATRQDEPVTSRVTDVTTQKNDTRRRYRPELPEECRKLIDEVRKRDLDFRDILQAGLSAYSVLGEL